MTAAAVAPARRVLVVGGGLIGGRSAHHLRAGGHAVTVYSRSINPWLALRVSEGLDVDVVRGQVPLAAGQPPTEDLDALVGAADVVVMLAGTSTPAFSDQDAVGSVVGSVIPLLSVLDAMRRTRTSRIVIASSGGTVYGRATVTPTPEDHPTEPISLHGLNSLAAERYAAFFAATHDLSTTVLRFSNVYGPGQQVRGGQGVVAAWCEALAASRPVALIGAGTARRDLLHAEDAAQAVTLAVESGVEGTYNVGGTSVALTELLSELGAIAGVQPVVEQLPARGVDVPATELDCRRYAAATGWSPRMTLREGLQDTWAWYAGRRGAA